MTRSERWKKIESYGATSDKLLAALLQFPREMWQFRSAPDDWLDIYERHVPEHIAQLQRVLVTCLSAPPERKNFDCGMRVC
jgi:hypothetical protein